MPSQVSNSSAPASAQIPPAPNSAQSPVQNNEDESDDEYGGYMRSSSPALPEASSDGPDGFPSFPSSDGDELNASAARSRTAPPNNVGPLRNETAAVRHLSERLKLHPYQHAASEELLKAAPAYASAQLFTQLCALHNKLDSIVSAAPPFAVTPALHLTVKSYIIAVLLSAKLSAYSGAVPRDHVLALIMRDRTHLPHNFDTDPYAAKVLKEEVTHELAQAWGKLKKTIKASHSDARNVFDAATAIVQGMSCTVTIPLCGRVALFRKVYSTDPSEKYWESVDRELVKIRTKAGEDPVKITRVFAGILRGDQLKYPGNEPAIDIPPTAGMSDVWQQGIDNLIEGIRA